MERNLADQCFSNTGPEIWDHSGHCLCRAANLPSLVEALAHAAAQLAPFFRFGTGGLRDLGVHVVDLPLKGRRGAIVDRWGKQIVLVNDRESSVARNHIMAHEAAHLLLGRVQREGHLDLSVLAEERLCEYFVQSLNQRLADAGDTRV